MNGLEKIVEYIRADTEKECAEIAQSAAEECSEIKAEYSKREQAEYWKTINEGTKTAEQRLDKLSAMAALEAKKQISEMQKKMTDEAFNLAATKLKSLSGEDFSLLLEKLGLPPGTSAEDLVQQNKERLFQAVTSMLFD